MLIIVFVSLEPWDEIWRRNQFICDGLLQRFDEAKILFVQPPFDNSYALRTRNLGSVKLYPSCKPDGYGGRLHLFTPTKWFPNSLRVCRAWNELHLLNQIKQVLRDLGWIPTHLWINQHEAAQLVGEGIAPSAIYDITDDWTKFSGNQSQLALTIKQDAILCNDCDHVVVCSQQLFDDKCSFLDEQKLHLIPNGVHIDHYETVSDTSLPDHSLVQGWNKPVFGYTGTIHADRIDINLIAAVAQAYPMATIAMVGPNLLEQFDQRILDKFNNIVFTGAIPYSQLPDIMRAFSVCMVPHLVTPFTESLNPIKLWEYLAAGKPIVTTNVAGFRDFPDLLYVSATYAEFIKNLSTTLTADKSSVSDRQGVARLHSWDSRLDSVVRVLVD